MELRLRRENVNKHMGKRQVRQSGFRYICNSKRAPKAVQKVFQGGFCTIWGHILGLSTQEKQPEKKNTMVCISWKLAVLGNCMLTVPGASVIVFILFHLTVFGPLHSHLVQSRANNSLKIPMLQAR